ncbi:ribosome biogenesis GTP-binding protein YihA/YsxC [Sinomicrobium soli]|uniref:ribosome biogenesis GTP-binding protein YihA/YsxC n=1 Tax=Sinomicrobium sp. N-1-3-6 TaxID=2219864 RepID=UPI000DCCEFB5|nr:ribosome biogenesis GTP-binding protein YihA/YsxC [Sinomicrobium sp. N-1-3-6]RAV30700.1 YihA family ribosome biogenesis GTP-binding protein [Sinomicrobium sp. N-1-3-6]
MQIHSAEFVISNTDVGKCPKDPIPEYAFIGRSNVGKSSLINMITNRKGLAKTSGTPGKTQLINHFRMDNRWFLVDLPGYGYARVSKKQRKGFQKLITDYFEKRKQLVCAFVLIDLRLEPQKTDLEFMYWLGTNSIPFTIVFTKADKLKPAAVSRKTGEYLQKLTEDAWEEAPPHIVTSAQNGTGKDELLGYIEHINQQLK